MDAKTLEALKASIAKWERNAEAKTADEYMTGWDNCPLCLLFIDDDCVGCPVAKAGNKGCFGTPYYKAEDTHELWKHGNKQHRDAAHAAARDEVAFLKSLLPEETP
jgi:hypothetical protein